MNLPIKTLIILTPGFPANEEDSTCVPFPQSFVKNLKQLNPSLNIVILAFQYPFSVGIYKWHGMEVHTFGGENRGKIYRLLLWISIWRRLKRIIRENDTIGILCFWLGEGSLIAKYAARRYNFKTYTWILGQDAKTNNRYVSIIRPEAESLIALSDFISEEYFRNYKMKPAYTIPPGLDFTLFPVSPVKRDIDILGAGSLIPLKQYDQFVRLIAGLARSKPDIKAVICGDGPERAKLEQMIRQYEMIDQIKLVGELNHGMVLAYMQRAKIFLHPSSYEGFGMVCAEALYAGAIVVSYCKPMNAGFQHQYTVNSQKEMEMKVRELLAIGNLNEERILTFPIEDCCKKILALYY